MSVLSNVAVQLTLDGKKFKSGAAAAGNEAEKLNGRLKRLNGALKSIASTASGFIVANVIMRGASMVTNAVKTIVGAAMSMNETMSKTKAVFGESADEIINWSKSSAQNVGMAQQEALNYLSTFGAIAKSAGVDGDKIVGFSTDLVTASADLGSFWDFDPQQVAADIQSGLAGQSEPLRKYNIYLTEAAVRQEAYRTGIAATGAELTEQQKIQARASFILNNLGDAQGDFAKTSGGLTNGLRIMRSHFKNLQVFLGNFLLPILTKVVTWGNKTFAMITDLTGKGMKPMAAVSQVLKQRLVELFGKERAAQILGVVGMIKRGIKFLIAVLGQLVKGVRLVLRFIGFLIDHFETIKPVLIGLVGAFLLMHKVVPGIQSVTKAVKVLRMTMFSISPVFLIIAAAIALLYLAWTNNWFGIRDKTKVVVDWLIKKFKQFRKFIQPGIDAIKTLASYWEKVFHNEIQPGNLTMIPKWMRPIALVTGRVVKSLRIFFKVWKDKGFLAALKTIPTQIRAFGRALGGFLTQITGLKSVGALIKKQFAIIADTIKNVIELIDNIVHGRWKAAFGNLKNIALNGLKMLWTGISGSFAILMEIMGKIDWGAVGKLILNALWAGLQWTWENLIVPGLMAFPQAFYDLLALGWDLLYSVGNYLIGALSSGITFGWNWLLGWFDKIPGWLTAPFSGLWNAFYSIGWSIIAGMSAGIQSIWNTLVGWIDSIMNQFNRIPDFLKPGSPSKTAIYWAVSVGTGLVKGLKKTLGVVESAVGKVKSALDLSGVLGAGPSAAMAGAGAMGGGTAGSYSVAPSAAVGGATSQPISIATVIVQNPANGEEVVRQILRAVKRRTAGMP